MNIKELAKYTVRPELYTPGTAIMWTDKYISAQLLKIHLDKETDLASRKNSSIKKTVNWIAGRDCMQLCWHKRDTLLQVSISLKTQ
jgi:hypothetical protein